MQVTPQDVALVVCQIGLFVVLFLALKYLWFAPVGRIIHERAHRSEGALAEAKEIEARVEALRAQHAATLERVRADAQREVQEILRTAEVEHKRRLAVAREDAERMLEDARRQIAREVEEARAELHEQVRTLAKQAAQSVLGRAVG